jgi:hypothetical protein
MIDAWRVIDVTGWPETEPEKRGARAKIWICGADGRTYLRKSPEVKNRRTRPYEIATETLAQGIARAIGLEAAEAWPCIWREGEIEKRGILVLKFGEPEEALTAGAAVMRRLDPDYDPDTQLGEHTLERVREALIDQERRAPGTCLLVPFAKMVLCDAWLGNGDRHAANWSILESARGVRLAPCTTLLPASAPNFSMSIRF